MQYVCAICLRLGIACPRVMGAPGSGVLWGTHYPPRSTGDSQWCTHISTNYLNCPSQLMDNLGNLLRQSFTESHYAEEAIALGCRKFVACGGAGVLDRS